MVEAVWYSIVESIFFLTTQFKILSTVIELQSATGSNSSSSNKRGRRSSTMSTRSGTWSSGPAAVVYLKGFLRSCCYIANIVMSFLSIGGFFPLLSGTSWVFYGLNVVLLVMITDASRFQQALELLQKHCPEDRQDAPLGDPESADKRISFAAPQAARMDLGFSKFGETEIVACGEKVRMSPDVSKVVRASVMSHGTRCISFSNR
ncbi:hypothetical protein BJ742DRAFT_812966 [Cladochytrium replicatum]|nr:hypothetical protein BJ742DRAFT_812966 [Cladochytrium replicatum]